MGKNECEKESLKDYSSQGLCRILIVDDDDFFRETLGEYLCSKNYRVVMASNVLQGVEVLKNDKDIQAVFCDYHMPSNKGSQLAALVKGNKLGVPVIIVSNDAARGDLIDIIKSGAFNFLEKGEGFEAMLMELKKALRERARELIKSYHLDGRGNSIS